jgi:hypothetical protein
MKNVINLDKARKKQERKVVEKRVIDSWRKSIIADLKMKFGNKDVEANMPRIQKQLDELQEKHFEKANG